MGIGLALSPFVWTNSRSVGKLVRNLEFYNFNRSLRIRPSARNRLPGIEQISAFMLPRLATLLNATETSLLLRATQPAGSLPSPGTLQKTTSGWIIYRHLSKRTSGMSKGEHPDEWLAGIANLALM